jgi:hypothetical protein
MAASKTKQSGKPNILVIWADDRSMRRGANR